MVEWHITPDYICRNWTHELFELMVEKLVERKERERQQAEKARGNSGDHEVSPELLFNQASNLVKVVKE